ncbi:AGAP008794-PA, partial [Anopheles gambiae str. PEST]
QPRIDPMKLLVCLSVLLAPNGGIRNAGEVRRLANLMAKFSKKLVSKAIYIQILKCTETELLGQFMQTGGWSLVHMWLVDGIGSKNWPLIQELMELLLCCPVDVERLKINSTPRLVKSLSTDSANESVKVLASKLVEQWLYIVKAPKQLSPMVPINQSELPAITGLAGTADGKQTGAEAAIGQAPTVGAAVVGKQGVADIAGKEQQHYQRNGYGSHAADSGEVDGQTETANHDGMVDGDKTTFQPTGEAAATVVPAKKTSLVLKITTKNGKQVVAKVIKSSTSRKGQRDSADGRAATDGEGAHPDDGDEEEDDDDDEEDQEEVVVNIESSKPSGEEATVAAPVAKKDDQLNAAETKKVDVHRDKDKSSSGGSRDGKESKAQSASPKLARARSRDDSVGCSNDSGSETSSVTNTSANDSKVAKSTTIPSKKASISIEVRNPENRVKTVKTYNSQFRSHGLIEEAPPPPSRKGLKKPSSASSPSSTVIGSTATGTLKRSSPTSSSGRDAVLAGVTAEKRAKEDPMERPGSIKLIPPKRQHALVESDMFMDALSATLRKDHAAETTAPTPTTPTSPKVPTIAPMSFYRDTLAEQEEETGTEPTAGEDGEEKKVKKEGETVADDKTELMDVVMSDVEKKIALEAESGVKKEEGGTEKEEEDGKKPPGPGCGPDGPPGVLVIHRRKGPKKQLRWRAAEELEEVRYFELDVTERCNVTKSFTDMKQMERVDERQKFMLSRKVGSEDIMVERTAWRPLLQVDNVPPSPDGSQSLERNVQRQRERGCLQALYFNKHMIPDSPAEPDPADTYQTADPVHIPLEDVTGNPDSVNDFTSMPWPDPRSTPPHESGAFSSPFFPSDLPPGAGFGAGGFPPPFAPGAAATIGPGPWNLGVPVGAPGVGAGGPRAGVLPPGMFPLSQPPPGLVGQPAAGGSPNMLNLPLSMSPNVPPPGMFPGANNFNAPPPELGVLAAGGVPDMGGRRGDGFRNGPPPHQQWTAGGNRPFGGGGNNNPNRGGGGGGFGNRGGGGNWNNRNQGNNNNNGNGNRNGDRSRIGDDGRGNFRGHWLQGGNRGHNNNRGGGGGRKW